jgi:hypothetical protein
MTAFGYSSRILNHSMHFFFLFLYSEHTSGLDSFFKILFIFLFEKYFKKNFIFFNIFLEINIFLIFLDYFDMMMLKITFKN